MLYEDPSSGEDSTYMHLVPIPSTAAETSQALTEYGKSLLTALFDTEVVKRIAMGVYKTAKIAPTATSLDAISQGVDEAAKVLANAATRPSQAKGWDRAIWSDAECVTEILICIQEAVVGKLIFN